MPNISDIAQPSSSIQSELFEPPQFNMVNCDLTAESKGHVRNNAMSHHEIEVIINDENGSSQENL